MRTEWFIVHEALGKWWIDNEGTAFGPFDSREQAGTEALEIVRNFHNRGRRPRIYWPDAEGRQRLAWEGV